MGKIALSLKINVSEIDKARLFAGQKGKYLDCTIFVDLDQLDQYGNSGMITQDVSKEEKAQGVKGPILGNGKIFWRDDQQAQQAPQQQYQQQAPQQMPSQQLAQKRQQQAPVNQAAPMAVDFDDSIPF